MKRYTIRLTHHIPEISSAEEDIQEQIEALSRFVSIRGITIINGLREEYAVKIEVAYNEILAILADLHQNFSGKDSAHHSIQRNLDALKQAFRNLENDPLCRNYTAQMTYSDIAEKIHLLETNIIGLTSSLTPSI